MKFLIDGPDDAEATILLGHGARMPMDAPWMGLMTARLIRSGLRVVRFEFSYMAARRDGLQVEPMGVDELMGEYRAAIFNASVEGRLIIGGKSMSAGIATMVADEFYERGALAGVLCFGMPFHDAGRPEIFHAGNLADIKAPVLIVQGTHDPMGNRQTLTDVALSDGVEMIWVEGGNHDLGPQMGAGSLDANLALVAGQAGLWAGRLISTERPAQEAVRRP